MAISKKLITGFLTIAIVGIIIGAAGIICIINLKNNQQATYDQCTLGIEYASQAEINYLAMGKAVLSLQIYYDDVDTRAQYTEKAENYIAAIDENLEKYKTTIASEEGQAQFDTTKATFEPYMALINDNMDIAKAGGSSEEFLANIQKAAALAQSATDAFEALSEYSDKVAQENLVTNTVVANTAMYVMIGLIVVSVIISLFLALLISGIISKPMQKFAVLSEHLAVGDVDTSGILTEEDLQLKNRKDEIGKLALAFHKLIEGTVNLSNQMAQIATGDLTTVVTVRSEKDIMGKALAGLVEKFHALAVSIVSTSDQVDSHAKEVAGSSISLSQGATEQASAVEELSASMEEITSQTELNAQNAQKTSEITSGIQKDADASNTQMSEMLHAMEEINASSDSISKIIKVIEDIAFQTNILALNAAVEAARAGQYGKGFAVVADEVRNLAAKSAEAAKETAEMIETSINKVGIGTGIANETAVALGKIVAEISRAYEFVNEIAVASSEQAAGLEQINQGIMQVSQVVQTNAAAAEESAAASEELSAQADNLKQFVSVFKTNTAKTMFPKKDLKSKSLKDDEESIWREDKSTEKAKKPEPKPVHTFSAGADTGKY
ncbi:MAG: methyl-accepting chemotaxis protein [Clostridia bacterium]|nr:methyl-accepting chemotaxis protein [Clostridia bacterium]